MDVAAIVVLAFSTAGILCGWWIFEHLRLPKPELGVFSLGDVGFMLVAVVLLPPLYLAVPTVVVAGILLLVVASSLHTLFSAILTSHRTVWSIVLLALSADVALALWLGPHEPALTAINNILLVAFTGSVAPLWVQSGLRARDAAILTAGVALYDLIATGFLPLTDNLIVHLAEIPLAPVVRWGQTSIGLGDLLIATLLPVVCRKAFSETAGLVSMTTAILGIFVALVLRVNGPLMTGIGPMLIAEYLVWRRVYGPERTTWQYLRKNSSRQWGETCVDTTRLPLSRQAASSPTSC